MGKMFKTTQERLTEQFAKTVLKLEPIEFLGVTKVLCVDVLEKAEVEGEKPQPKNFYQIYDEMIDVFAGMKKKQQRDLLDLIKVAQKKEKGKIDENKEVDKVGDNDGANTINLSEGDGNA